MFDLKAAIEQAEHLVDLAAFRPGSDYPGIRNAYIDDLAAAMNGYLESEGAITKWRNQARRAILNSFDLAFFTGYVDGGGNVSEMPEDDRSWLLARMDQEIGFVDALFQTLKSVRKESQDTGQSVADIVLQRATGYARSLDGVYKEGRLRAEQNKPYTFEGDDGQESCPTCQKLKGQRHIAKWWTERGLIPGQPGNPNYECGGYNCAHVLRDDDGNLLTA